MPNLPSDRSKNCRREGLGVKVREKRGFVPGFAILADQLTLFQAGEGGGGQIMPTKLQLGTQGFSELPTALLPTKCNEELRLWTVRFHD